MHAKLVGYLRAAVVERCSPVPPQTPGVFYAPVFLVPKRTPNTFRLIDDLRALNSLVPARRFRMESGSMLRLLLQPNDLMMKIDIAECFHLFSVTRTHRDLLRFVFNGQHYRYRALPMGHRWAPYLCTKVLRLVLRPLRQLGLRFIIYMDDLLLMANSAEQLQAHFTALTSHLQSLGFFLHPNKIIGPTTSIEFLGLSVDSTTMHVAVPAVKRRQLLHDVKKLLKSPTPRAVARLLGRLEFWRPTGLPIRYLTSHLHRLRSLAYTIGWTSAIYIPRPAREQLQALIAIVQQPITGPIHQPLPLWRLSTDASRKGWGAALYRRLSPDAPWILHETTRGVWLTSERLQSNNNRELRAVFLGFQSLARHLHHCPLMIETDNATTVSYLRRLGGPVPSLDSLVHHLLALSLPRRITLLPQFTPGAELTLPDRLSRIGIDRSSWRLHPAIYVQACRHHGLYPELDLFADRLNRQTSRFYSRFADPEALATDAFSQCWTPRPGHRVLWANPPFSLLLRVLRKALNEKATMLLCLPVWPTAPWWPLVQDLPAFPVPTTWQRPYLPADPSATIHRPRWSSLVVRLGA